MQNLSVDEALGLVLEEIKPLPLEEVPLVMALDRIIGEAVCSPVNLPLFSNSAMDGYALKAVDTAAASAIFPAKLAVIGEVAAGEVFSGKLERGQAIRIMTGAALPEGADAVVKFEDTDEAFKPGSRAWNSVEIFTAAQPGQNVRLEGEDFKPGQPVLPTGTVLNPGCLGLVASLGYASVKCVRKPRVAILATGSELLQAGQPPLPGKIYNSNNYILAALVTKYGGEVVRLSTVQDRTELIEQGIAESLAQKPDLLITSGGVSVGDFDLVKQVLGTVGELQMWQVRMRPGKPVAFGEIAGIPLLGLPGNPLAALVSFELFGKAALLKMLQCPPGPELIEAITVEPVRNSSGRRNFLRGKLFQEEGRLYVRPSRYQMPSQLASLVESDCLIVAGEDCSYYLAGDKVAVMPLYRLEKSLSRAIHPVMAGI